MSLCSNCGKPLAEDASFCSECGHQEEAGAEKVEDQPIAAAASLDQADPATALPDSGPAGTSKSGTSGCKSAALIGWRVDAIDFGGGD